MESSSTAFRSWAWQGDAFSACDSVPLADRGFRYGMSFFESIRVLGGKPQFLQEHLQRLQRACFARSFPIPSQAIDGVEDLLKTQAPDGLARIYVTAGDGGVTAPVAHSRVYILAEARPTVEMRPYRIGVTEEAYHALFDGLKTANYWANLSALQAAAARGEDEALLFNERAELVSACMANVFVVTGGEVRTPALECGARAGVIRERVLSQIAVRVCSVFLDDVLAADEVFLTSSWIGVQSVGTINGRILSSKAIASELRSLAYLDSQNSS